MSDGQPEDLQGYVDAALPMLDDVLVKENLPVPYRPLQAAQLFAKHLVISVSSGTLQDVEGQKWFAIVFAHVQKWYENRYGAALSADSAHATSVVQILGGLFELKIPMTAIRKAEEEDHIWVVFPKEVLPEEDALQWLVAPPNLSSFGNSVLQDARQKVEPIVNRLRNSRNSLTTANVPSGAEPALAMYAHADQAARLIFSNTPASLKLAIWELNFLCESVLKYRLKQLGLAVPREHDVSLLCASWPDADRAKLTDSSLALMPSGKNAVKYRYGEGDISLKRVLEIYSAALQIFDEASAVLSRTYQMDNAQFLLKRPPWMEFLGQ